MVVIIMILLAGLVFGNDIEQYIADAPKRKTEKAILRAINDSLTLVLARQEEYNTFWKAASLLDVQDSASLKQIEYGRDLIVHTSRYLGPKGSVLRISNGMNCQNCHLDAGTRPWGNNYGSVFSTYPRYRPRSGTEEDIYKRINDCIERSLNGKPLDTAGAEMQAVKAYIEYIGSNVKKGKKAKASGIYELPFISRAANPIHGKELYITKCASCHQVNGQGLLAIDGMEYTYPPLWGKNSYNIGAGLFRLSRFAGYIKYNMPQGATFLNPQLSDEEAWDIAAFVNSQTRPTKDLKNDWPAIDEKPVDHPFGPFADTFTEEQHKFGPYQPIADIKELKIKNKIL